MRKQFLLSIVPVLGLVFLMGHFFSQTFFGLYIILVPIYMLGIYDLIQKKHTILRNYPVLGHFRYLLESIRPEIQQYFIERFNDGTPFSREQRSLVYQRAKGDNDKVPFGTEHDLYRAGNEWLEHSLNVFDNSEGFERVKIGNSACKKPYMASHLNISAMSYGSLSRTAVMAMNKGAKLGDFFHNTGEGGISPYHNEYGGDLCWQIGTGYFGCRAPDGNFDEEMFAKKCEADNVKLIELKLSQGAKPGHGGILPGEKVNEEIAEIRAVEIGKDVISPPTHKAFSTPMGLIKFIQKMRELSGGKPVGFKLCVGKKVEFYAICKAMLELQIYPDFISVDGAEGGTGAAPREFTNNLGTPLNEGLDFVHNTLVGCGLRSHIKIIASGKIIDAFSMITKLALGADILNSARGMMMAVGCIQALRCHLNDCPTGVATQDETLYKLLDVDSKAERVERYHRKTIHEMAFLLGSSGFENIHSLKKEHIKRRIGPGDVVSYAKLYPEVESCSILNGGFNPELQVIWDRATAEEFTL